MYVGKYVSFNMYTIRTFKAGKFSNSTGWKDKQHYSFILKLLLIESIQVTWLCSRADIYSM